MTQQRYWHNAATLETYPMRLDIEPGQGCPLDSNDLPRDGFELMPDGWEPPIIEPPIQPDFLGFRNAIEELVTEPFLNTLNAQNTAMMLSLRDGFLNQDIANIIKYWNRAITHYGNNLIPVLETPIQDNNTTKSRADFAREKASFYHLPINLSPDYFLELI